MAISVKSIRCPECGANLEVESNRDSLFCSYCGTKIIVTNENEYIYRHIDEAGIRKAETDRIVRMRELDIAEGDNLTHKILTIVWLVVSLILITIGVIICLSEGNDDMPGWAGGFLFLFYVCAPVIGGGAYIVFNVLPGKQAERIVIKNGGVRFPKHLEPFSDKNYEYVATSLKEAGFYNVSCINLHDLTLGLLQKPGKIDNISIDGERIISGGKYYMPDVNITITYHGR